MKGRGFQDRTKELHSISLLTLKENKDVQSVDGMKSDCALKRLSHFTTVKGFLPEFFFFMISLSLYLYVQISKKYFTLDELIPNRLQQILKSPCLKSPVVDNGHENWTLLRLLPLIIGGKFPEIDKVSRMCRLC